jgi:hypothetical protein
MSASDWEYGAAETLRAVDYLIELQHEVTKATKTHEGIWMNGYLERLWLTSKTFVRLRALRDFVLQSNSEAVVESMRPRPEKRGSRRGRLPRDSGVAVRRAW